MDVRRRVTLGSTTLNGIMALNRAYIYIYIYPTWWFAHHDACDCELFAPKALQRYRLRHSTLLRSRYGFLRYTMNTLNI